MEIVVEELTSGLPNATEMVRISLRLVIAMLLGAMIGYEREHAGKAAGLRTHMLVSLGSALFVLIPMSDHFNPDGMSRVIQGIATGIGFIGTGAIIKNSEGNEIHGLTTAAGIWLTAAAGVAAGLGRLGVAIFSVLLALLILALATRLEKRLTR